jgi:uncharacterized membrane protein YraQ (UPF0718 family)
LDATAWILLGLVLVALAAAYAKDPSLPVQGLQASGRLFGGVWIELALGFALAGLIEVLIPASIVSRWLGSERFGHGILVGWGMGLVVPGGPYLVFPIAAKLFESGASPGALIAFLTAKTLVSPVRTLTYEVPLLGWPLTLARFLPGVLLPPLMGWLGQWLYYLMKPR